MDSNMKIILINCQKTILFLISHELVKLIYLKTLSCIEGQQEVYGKGSGVPL